MNDWREAAAAAAMLTLGLTIAVLAQQERASEAAVKQKKVVLFGDSTTAPRGAMKIYGRRLAEEFKEFTIVNSGVGGNTTDMAAKRFERDVVAHEPDIVVIQFGINDSAVDVWRNPPATQSRVPLDAYTRNIESFVKTLAGHGAKAILMTPNPCRWTPELKRLYDKPPYRTDDVDGWNVTLADYAQAVREVAEASGTPLVDVYAAFQNYARREGQDMNDLLLDGMHPNDSGHAIIAEMLIKTIKIKTIK
jgi:lysophospholipase L1-like esterase